MWAQYWAHTPQQRILGHNYLCKVTVQAYCYKIFNLLAAIFVWILISSVVDPKTICIPITHSNLQTFIRLPMQHIVFYGKIVVLHNFIVQIYHAPYQRLSQLYTPNHELLNLVL